MIGHLDNAKDVIDEKYRERIMFLGIYKLINLVRFTVFEINRNI